MREFDITGPMPSPGVTVLEASAGTGKTWTIAALVARYVAEGHVALDDMLVVTFGRAASQELRDKVRARLVEAERALADQDDRGDVLLKLLLAVDEPERLARLQRLREALSGFDGAAIVTIHQFCHTVLRGLGVAGDTDPNARLVDDLDDLLDEVVDDLYLNEVRGPDAAQVAAQLSIQTARQLAIKAALSNPLARLEPLDAHPASTAARKVRFAQAVREEFGRRKRRLGLLSYDDLLQQLADALEAPDSLARQRMRNRWSVVLVDEFQDTDPTQWNVFERAFHDVPLGEAKPTLVLIGDPKQAIYAFRGGDVFTYLQAKQVAVHTATLTRNYRTDAPVLDCVNVLLEGAQLGDPEIVVRRVAANQQASRLAGPNTLPFRLRALTRSMVDKAALDKPLSIAVARTHVAKDLAAAVHNLLNDGTTFEVTLADGTPERRVLDAGDIAVLAYARYQLAVVREQLTLLGIPSVLGGSGTVFGTSAAADWLTLLQAVEQPHRTDRVRAAALTPFFGHTIDSLAAGGEALTEELASAVRDWLDLFRSRGIAAVFEAALEAGMDARLLGTVNGERDLTDLRHLAEVLHREVIDGRAGAVALVAWLQEQMREDRDEVSGERTRRLDSDAHAVQLVTIHGSKGLEYPIVMLPFTFDRWPGEGRDELIEYHDDAGQRVLHVGGHEDRPDALDRRANAEELGERLRLLYVAMTRAQAQLIAWWAPTNNTATSELNRLIFGRKRGQGEVPTSHSVLDDTSAVVWMGAWANHGAFSLERADIPSLVPGIAAPPAAALSSRRFDREIDHGWRRTSYSSLAAPAHDAAVGSEPEVEVLDDESLPEVLVVAQADGAEHVPSPMADLPSGAQFGSLVHAVLEHADPTGHGGDLRAELAARIDDEWINWPQEVDRDLLADALVAVCQTPLGPAAQGRTLAQIPLRDRLCELDFELPLGGGDLGLSTTGVQLRDVAPLLRKHLNEDDPVRAWADALANPLLGEQDLRGYLTGSVDVVLRVDGRYLVVDYKTNWLGTFDEPLTSAAYTPAALDAAMGRSDYPLQALLYAVVLHRFLRWRLPDYDPTRDLGGVLYLYLRGMCGPETPIIDDQPCGVFVWHPPVALVEELSDLLDGGAS